MTLKAQTHAYDWLITGAVVYDGESPRPRQVDVAIHGERIAAVGNLSPDDARGVIDANGLVLMPGLIDAHTHSDMNGWIYPDKVHKLYQGVTMEIAGNCGMSAAPVKGGHKERFPGVWAREGVMLPSNEIPWESFQEYRVFMQKKGLANHLGVLVGHGNLRSAVMGFEKREASESEIAQMVSLLEEAMNEGALGISFGLVYLPGIFANEQELTALCRAAGQQDGVCAFHIRGEGHALLEAIEEAIRVGENAAAKIQISHLKAAGPQNWEKIKGAFDLIEKARARGVRVRADAYPYEASFAELGVVLPDALYQKENRDEAFADPAQSEELLREIETHFKNYPRNWEKVMVASVTAQEDKSAQGKTIAQIAAVRGEKPEKVLFDLLRRSRFEVSAFYFSQSPAVVEEVLSKDYVSPGSDSIADGIGYPHPRAFGTFPKLLKELFNPANPESLGVWVRKTTSEVADHFGLKDRGRIAPGGFADLVLFSPEKTKDKATYETPSVLAEGAEWVFVNGEPVIAEGRFNGSKKGRVLGQ